MRRSAIFLRAALAGAIAILAFGWPESARGQSSTTAALEKPLPAGASVFLAPVDEGFDIYLAAAIQQKKVPLLLVASRDKADYEIASVTESEKAGWAKMLLTSSDGTKEQAAIKVTHLRTGDVVFAYSVTKLTSARGKQSAAEACAKHLKKKIGK